MTSTPRYPETLKGKTIFMSGGSRGIGLAIALRAAADGANVAIAAKTAEPHPKLPGTVYTAAEEIKSAGGEALPLIVDIREEDQVAAAVEKTVETFGGVDILINNASAIRLTGTLETPVKRYDLMHQVNGRGTFVCSQACLPHLLKSDNPHILTLAPPPVSDPKWFKLAGPYSIAKYTMTLFTMGMAEEFRDKGVAINALWPRTAVATAAITNEIADTAFLNATRKPEIMGDAAHFILTRKATDTTGRFFIDDEALIAAGERDLMKYDTKPGAPLASDFFLEPLPMMFGSGL
ncbi:MAG: NAD(P)-dependent oxidoreductase [Pseudomonadota bacterium]